MSNSEQKEALRMISDLLNDPYNKICADCQCKPSEWASTTLGVFICINCSGVHRSLGTHISFVRSCNLDTWTFEQVRLMQNVGNKIANSYWEARIPDNFVRPDESNRSLMELFIRQKYAMKKWAADGLPPHLLWKSNAKLSEPKQKTRKKKSKRQKQTEPPKVNNKLVFKREDEIKTDDNNAGSSNGITKEQENTLDSFFSETYIPQKRNTIPQPYKPHQRKAVEFKQDKDSEIDSFFAEDYLYRKKLCENEAEKIKKQKMIEEQFKNDDVKDIGSIELNDLNECYNEQNQNGDGFIEEKPAMNLNIEKEEKIIKKHKSILHDVKLVNFDSNRGDLTELQNFFNQPTQKTQNVNNSNHDKEDIEKDKMVSKNEQNEINKEKQNLIKNDEIEITNIEEGNINQQQNENEITNIEEGNTKQQQNENEITNIKEGNINQQQNESKITSEITIKQQTDEQHSNANEPFNHIQQETNKLSNEEMNNNNQELGLDFIDKKTNSDSELYAFFETEYKEVKELREKKPHSFLRSDSFDEIDDFFFDAELNMNKNQRASQESESKSKEHHSHSHKKKSNTSVSSTNIPSRSSLAPIQRKAGNYLPKRLQRKMDTVEPKSHKKRHRH